MIWTQQAADEYLRELTIGWNEEPRSPGILRYPPGQDRGVLSCDIAGYPVQAVQMLYAVSEMIGLKPPDSGVFRCIGEGEAEEC